MYPEQFYLLEKGDIVRNVGSKSPRKILKVTKRGDETYYIEMQKLRPSWTRSPNMLMDANCAHLIVPIKVRNKRIWDLTHEVIVKQRERAYKHFATLQIRKMLKRIKKLRVK